MTSTHQKLSDLAIRIREIETDVADIQLAIESADSFPAEAERGCRLKLYGTTVAFPVDLAKLHFQAKAEALMAELSQLNEMGERAVRGQGARNV